MALIYRAHFVFIRNPRITQTGLNTSAVYGFALSLFEILEREKPTHLAVAFDTSAPTFRHEQFPAYKANREETPEDVRAAVPLVKRLLAALRIPSLVLDGYEADDLIGTVALHAAANGLPTYMYTPDKDYAQLVRENVWLVRPGKQGKPAEKYGPNDVQEKFGVRPDQIADFLGLKGDSVDNIPGVPKIGDKTAVQLLAEFGSLENLLDNLEKVSKKAVKASLEEHAAQGRLSKELAVIKTDVPYEIDLDSYLIEPPDREALRTIFDELEFKSLKKRILQESSATDPESDDAPTAEEAEPAFKTLADSTAKYVVVNSPEKRKALVAELLTQDFFCFDTETTSLDAHLAELVGIAFSWEAHTGYYVPFPADQPEAKALLEEFRPVFESGATKLAHNLKYDLLVLGNPFYELKVAGPFADTMLMHYAAYATQKHGMDALAEHWLNYRPQPISELIGAKKSEQISMREVPVAVVAQYAAEDADITLQLHQVLAPELDRRGVQAVYETVDLPLVPVLAQMERNGIRIDPDFLAAYSAELAEQIGEKEAVAMAEANARVKENLQEQGFLFEEVHLNLNSPKQLGALLFERLGLEMPGGGKAKKTRTGQYATDERTLQKLADAGHALPGLILEYRSLTKLKSTYVDALPELVNPKTGLIHTSYNQTVAVTGRLSSNNPNLQNIPIRTEAGRRVRRAFIPRDENHVLLSADYSQIELRIMASLSQDPHLVEAFAKGEDIHRTTAARVFDVPFDDVSSEQRRRAKMVNFGMIYGITPFGLADRLNIPRSEAQEIHSGFFEKFPAVKEFMDSCVAKAKKEGFVTTLLGRRHDLPNITSKNATVRGLEERNAINTPVQGTAADMIKLAMIRLQQELTAQKLAAKLCLQVHDELVLDVPKTELAVVKPLVERCMREALPLTGVPIEVGLGTGANWLDAH